MAAKNRTRRNKDIRAPQVRLIDQEGEQMGIVPLEQALESAQEAGMDLVEVSPNAEPPVCRIMDYGKFVFEQKKKQAGQKKQKQIQVKEVKFRPNTDDNDYRIKLRNATRFLEEGNKVKVTLRFRGREMLHQDIGRDLLKRVEEDLKELAAVEQFPKLEGRQMIMVMGPRKK
ncbi:translation initiation factor IF-3 [Natronospira bacteriovora]|uniref:Translation initiation factor IF-3 n=1 Tax=Natronospira bacteriovora TaxID=3069753 RepID=A0ABU0W5E4_9GAMM|nr:translation initiation factor IF-3 [Natronospira sp. AB-CW4]MDQ2069211.1 translation initiation factor IF-3 [Natronospira sp. AB-CW4]